MYVEHIPHMDIVQSVDLLLCAWSKFVNLRKCRGLGDVSQKTTDLSLHQT